MEKWYPPFSRMLECWVCMFKSLLRTDRFVVRFKQHSELLGGRVSAICTADFYAHGKSLLVKNPNPLSSNGKAPPENFFNVDEAQRHSLFKAQ